MSNTTAAIIHKCKKFCFVVFEVVVNCNRSWAPANPSNPLFSNIAGGGGHKPPFRGSRNIHSWTWHAYDISRRPSSPSPHQVIFYLWLTQKQLKYVLLYYFKSTFYSCVANQAFILVFIHVPNSRKMNSCIEASLRRKIKPKRETKTLPRSMYYLQNYKFLQWWWNSKVI